MCATIAVCIFATAQSAYSSSLHLEIADTVYFTQNRNKYALVKKSEGRYITFNIVDKSTGEVVFSPMEKWRSEEVRGIKFINGGRAVAVLTVNDGASEFKVNSKGGWGL